MKGERKSAADSGVSTAPREDMKGNDRYYYTHRRRSRQVLALCAGLAIACGTVFVPLAKAEQTKEGVTGYCIIPAWKKPISPNLTQETDESQYVTRIADLYTQVTPIVGVLPNTVNDAQEATACPITEKEIVMLAKVLKRECGGIKWQAYGVSAKARQAAVAWVALNRLDDPRYPDTLAGVLTYPSAFAWIPDTAVDDELLDLAKDVVSRWWREKNGETDVGRTIPANYFFFAGDGRENHFRDNYSAPFTYWEWSLSDPYTE